MSDGDQVADVVDNAKVSESIGQCINPDKRVQAKELAHVISIIDRYSAWKTQCLAQAILAR